MLDMTVTCSSGFLCLEIYPNLKVSLPIVYVWMPPGSEFDYASSTGRQKPSSQPKTQPSALWFESDAGVAKKAQAFVSDSAGQVPRWQIAP
jgi:hypothetical protein